MRAITIMLSGLLLLGLIGTAEARNDRKIEQCGKHTDVVDQDDGMVSLKEKKKKGCVIAVKALHPTQSAVGMDAAACKADKITAKARAGKLKSYLQAEKRWLPLVRGPGGVFYLTDHHHLSAAIWNADLKEKEKKVFAYLIADWSELHEDAFWALMVKHNNTWLKNPADQDIKPSQLPASIGAMQDDPMRTLSAWVRGSCGYVKCDAPGSEQDDEETTCQQKFAKAASCAANVFFLEFKWGHYLGSVPAVQTELQGIAACSQQDPLDRQCLDKQYAQMVKALPAAMQAAAAPGALQALGDGAGYHPQAQTGVPQPKRCD